jgi:hypothetical protein
MKRTGILLFVLLAFLVGTIGVVLLSKHLPDKNTRLILGTMKPAIYTNEPKQRVQEMIETEQCLSDLESSLESKEASSLLDFGRPLPSDPR